MTGLSMKKSLEPPFLSLPEEIITLRRNGSASSSPWTRSGANHEYKVHVSAVEDVAMCLQTPTRAPPPGGGSRPEDGGGARSTCQWSRGPARNRTMPRTNARIEHLDPSCSSESSSSESSSDDQSPKRTTKQQHRSEEEGEESAEPNPPRGTVAVQLAKEAMRALAPATQNPDNTSLEDA